MYFAFPLLWRFPEHITEAQDIVAASDEQDPVYDAANGGDALLTTMQLLLHGLHLTKGFTSDVRIILIHSYIEYIFGYIFTHLSY